MNQHLAVHRFVILLPVLLLTVTQSRPICAADRAQDELTTRLKPSVDLDQGWKNPPRISRTRCWWWWLNGNVTKDAITRDLEEMKSNGLGGANIIDAGGADQRGNNQVPHGPAFGSTEWQRLFIHALEEAKRLELELGFNIQSGWNLGGPTVTPEQAAKKLAFAEVVIKGGQHVEVSLPVPKIIDGYYRDIAVLAIPIAEGGGDENPLQVTASSSQAGHPPGDAVDGKDDTFWVSGTDAPDTGPSVEEPVFVKLEFATPVVASEVVIVPREGYGPKRGWLQCADDPQRWRILNRWTGETAGPTRITFPRTRAKMFRLVIVGANDPKSPLLPRNAQIAEIQLKDGRKLLTTDGAALAKIDDFPAKAYYEYPGRFTAPKADHLLHYRDPKASEQVVRPASVVDVRPHVDQTGNLNWNVPRGSWKVLRLGYTLAGSRVSTSSEGWNGWAIDYLDPAAFDQYWRDVVAPLLDAATPYLGSSLRFLHTDSWELGPVNWTPAFPQEFKRLRGYELQPYLPALAGYVVESSEQSNRFLNDFRRTLADLIAENNYGNFQRHAREFHLGIHPESGGPHAAPIDSLKNFGRSDIPMGEFWAKSPTHRVLDAERFFTKQPASAAHVYGKRIVLAEAFTSIGPQWEEDPRSLKPAFDQAACEGLNLTMLHTFDLSPDSMGEPGQAYFAGTHFNRHVTWWRQGKAFIDYLNRCQFLLQQGVPVADVLFFYGENIPSFVRLKDDDPAGVLPGHDYDVINAEALLQRTSVRGGRIVLPEGTEYRVLVLPGSNNYGLPVLEHIAKLLRDGALIVGPKPTAPSGLSGGDASQTAFASLADKLWKPDTGLAVSPGSARDALQRLKVPADFLATSSGERPMLDYIHRRTDSADIYFVANRRDRWQDVECSFRITGKLPELWDPVTGTQRDAATFSVTSEKTTVPLRFPPTGAMFVVFRRIDTATPHDQSRSNEPRPEVAAEVVGPWTVQFDPARGGPKQPTSFAKLASWSDRPEPGVRYYSGTASYHTVFDLPVERASSSNRFRWWVDLGLVKNIATVRLNGTELGIAWTDPFRLELTEHLRAEENDLVIEVTNLWPNRLIGDQNLPPQSRITRTNITKFRADTPLLESGLLGPVRLMVEPMSEAGISTPSPPSK